MGLRRQNCDPASRSSESHRPDRTSPCNRHHLELAKRVREGIRAAGGVAFEFPCHPIQETGKRPTAALDRNLAYLRLVEVLYGYPLDGVVLMTGCDKTTPACLMAAATVNLPAIVLSGGPMLNAGGKASVQAPVRSSGRRAKNWLPDASTIANFWKSLRPRLPPLDIATPWARPRP